MNTIFAIERLSKTYGESFSALKGIDLAIERGEIFALLGPNGAGKTTLIGIVCGLVRASSGRVIVDGSDIATDYRSARRKIGLVPQELSTNQFETVLDAMRLFARPVRQARRSRSSRTGPARPLAVGQEESALARSPAA